MRVEKFNAITLEHSIEMLKSTSIHLAEADRPINFE